VSWFMYIM
jgi:hypothetical protein